MRFFERRLALAALALLAPLAGCQPLPRPFASAERTLLLDLPDSLGIVVADVTGVAPPLAQALRDAMVEALGRHNLPAISAHGNRGSFRLAGIGRLQADAAGQSTLLLAWDLADWSSQPVGRVEHSAQAGAADWPRYTVPELARIADAAAQRIATLVKATGQAGSTAMAAVAEPPGVLIRDVSGAPGDGNAALAKALAAALKVRGVRIARPDEPSDGERPTVAGTVRVVMAAAGQDRVEMVWRLIDPQGGEIGTVDQANMVRAGSLDGTWGAIAEAAADGAATGIAQLLKQAERRSAGRAGQPVYTAPPR